MAQKQKREVNHGGSERSKTTDQGENRGDDELIMRGMMMVGKLAGHAFTYLARHYILFLL